jgi:hypothetical protein
MHTYSILFKILVNRLVHLLADDKYFKESEYLGTSVIGTVPPLFATPGRRFAQPVLLILPSHHY